MNALNLTDVFQEFGLSEIIGKDELPAIVTPTYDVLLDLSVSLQSDPDKIIDYAALLYSSETVADVLDVEHFEVNENNWLSVANVLTDYDGEDVSFLSSFEDYKRYLIGSVMLNSFFRLIGGELERAGYHNDLMCKGTRARISPNKKERSSSGKYKAHMTAMFASVNATDYFELINRPLGDALIYLYGNSLFHRWAHDEAEFEAYLESLKYGK